MDVYRFQSSLCFLWCAYFQLEPNSASLRAESRIVLGLGLKIVAPRSDFTKRNAELRPSDRFMFFFCDGRTSLV